MQLLLFSDLHNDRETARQLVAKSKRVDVVVGAGDFCNAHHGLGPTIDVLSEINCPAVLVPGNAETDDELRAACVDWPSAIVLHGDGVEIGGIPFFGLGGGIPITPFGAWSFDFTEEQAGELLESCAVGGVLVTHSPPAGLVDVSSRGQSLGSTAILSVVERRSPRLVVCGHIHASAGQLVQSGKSIVINAGPSGIVHEL